MGLRVAVGEGIDPGLHRSRNRGCRAGSFRFSRCLRTEAPLLPPFAAARFLTFAGGRVAATGANRVDGLPTASDGDGVRPYPVPLSLCRLALDAPGLPATSCLPDPRTDVRPSGAVHGRTLVVISNGRVLLFLHQSSCYRLQQRISVDHGPRSHGCARLRAASRRPSPQVAAPFRLLVRGMPAATQPSPRARRAGDHPSTHDTSLRCGTVRGCG